MRALLALIKKDLLVEFRTKETVVLMAALALLLSVIASFGAGSAFLDPATERKLYPALLWLIFVFSATVCIGRSYDFELEHMGIEGLVLSGVSSSLIYCSKVATNFLVILMGHIFAIAALSILLNVEVLPVGPQLVLLSALVIAGYSALSTVLAAVGSTSRLKNMLLPLILLPLLFPIFFAALELTAELLANQRIEFDSLWFTLLIGLNVLYILLGINLYGYVIKE